VTVRLRYLGYDVTMPDGEFVLGRGPGCRLCLNDPIVSRRHAIVIVKDGAGTIEDLGSRNGVIVNKVRIEGRHALVHGDTIVIGGQELVFYVDRTGKSPPPPERPELAPLRIDAPPRGANPFVVTTVGQSVIAVGQRLEAFSKIGQVALDALGRGRADEAERILERPLAEILSTSRCGLEVDTTLVELAARYAARLAEATRKGYWVDYIFDLYTIRAEALPLEIIGALRELSGRVGEIDKTTIKIYVAVRAKAVAQRSSLAAAHAEIESLAQKLLATR
jgi:pSer/pThr/pTyr-binding forkhead associated (FHA) protein